MAISFLKKIIKKALNYDKSNFGGFFSFLSREFPNFSFNDRNYFQLNNDQKDWRNLYRGPIMGLAIMLTHKCNLECSYCLRNTFETKENPEIDFKTIQKIIFSANRFGCRECGITGGEPLLYPKLKDVINILGDLGWFVGIETNGRILNSDDCSFFKERIGDKLMMSVSLDGFCRESHDYFRGKGSFDSAINAIKLIKARGIKLEVNAILTPKNFMTEKELLEFMNFNKNLGVDFVRIGRIIPFSRGCDKKFLLTKNQVVEFGNILKKYNFLNPILQGGAFFQYKKSKNKNNGWCPKKMKQICVSPAGVHHCIFLEGIKSGELEEFESVVLNERMRNFMIFVQGIIAESYLKRNIPFYCSECVYEFSKLSPFFKEFTKYIK